MNGVGSGLNHDQVELRKSIIDVLKHDGKLRVKNFFQLVSILVAITGIYLIIDDSNTFRFILGIIFSFASMFLMSQAFI